MSQFKHELIEMSKVNNETHISIEVIIFILTSYASKNSSFEPYEIFFLTVEKQLNTGNFK